MKDPALREKALAILMPFYETWDVSFRSYPKEAFGMWLTFTSELRRVFWGRGRN